jgi:hypothetical protein
MLPGALSDPTPGGPNSTSPRYSPSATSLTSYSSMAAVPDLHNATCDHTDGEHAPHASYHNEQLDPWSQLLNFCSASASPNMTDRHRSTSQLDCSRRHSQTPRDFSKPSCPLFHRKHSDSTDFQTLALI